MCSRRCAVRVVFAFGAGLIVSSFCDGGISLFLVGLAFIILSLAIRLR